MSLVVVAFLATLPLWAEAGTLREIDEIACYLIYAMMWNLLAGYGGMVSIGQQAFLGLGGYALLVMGNFAGINPFVAVPLAAIVTALIAIPVAQIAFRLQGGTFAIGTWVIAEVFRLSIANWSAVGGGSGTSLTALRGIEKATRIHVTFWLCLAAAVVAIGATYLLLRSRQGLALLAIRDSEVASESQGIHVRRTKLGVYVAAAFGAGLAGALYFLGNLRISPDAAFTVNWSAFGIFIVMIGGIGTIEGPIIGALIFYLLNKIASDFGTWYLVGLGAAGDRRHHQVSARAVGRVLAPFRRTFLSGAASIGAAARRNRRLLPCVTSPRPTSPTPSSAKSIPRRRRATRASPRWRPA